MLLERHEALACLDELLTETASGHGGAAVISGVVGSGKTELLNVLTETAQSRGFLILHAAGVRAERSAELGLLGQLLQDAPLPPESARHLLSLLDAAVVGERTDPLAPLPTRLLHAINAFILELAARGPVLIMVDDVHWSDHGSLQCLLHLLRRARSAPVLVVFAESKHAWQANPLFHIGLLRESRCRWISTALLSDTAVAQLTGTTANSSELFRLTGGNPLLLRALAADQGRLPADTSAPTDGGRTFGQAVVSCLYRVQPAMRSVARGVAVFGTSVPTSLLARLVNEPEDRVVHAVQELEEAGLLRDGYFRHPASAQAVLDNLSESRRRVMHARAAELLYHEGRNASAVAAHLLAADHTELEWARATLCEAAEVARLGNNLDLAVRCLDLAARSCADPAGLAEAKLFLAEVQWRLNPAAAARHLPELLTALRSGDLPDRHANTVVRMLLWHGQVTDADEVLMRVEPVAGSRPESDSVAGLRAARVWIRATSPKLVASPASDSPTLADFDPASFGPVILNTVLSRGGDDATSAAAERLLSEADLEHSFDSLEAGLYALVYADRLKSAARYSARLAELAAGRDAPTWHARLAVVQAEIALRRGDMHTAERHAQTALSRLPRRAWGAVVGAPLGALLLALSGSGRLREAAQIMAEPVADSLFQTRFGILYAYALGQFKLASGRPSAAIQEFRACGRQMQAWGIDLPAFVPWRSAAAIGYVRTDDAKTARKLIEAQLARPGATAPRTYGVSMRQLAAASSTRDRPKLLRQAIENLQAAGDRLELAYALADLSRAHEALGEPKRAQAMSHQALKLARECHADPLARSLRSHQPEPTPPARPRPILDEADPAVLSEAERRVAELASMGYTNREVADALFITVSTVEQHLTRIYRKLNLGGRSDLSMTGSLWVGTGPAWSSAPRREDGALRSRA